MKLSPKTPVILSLAFLTAACSVTKDMDKMSNTMNDMSSKISTMSDTTTHLSATNDQVLTSIKETNATGTDTDNAVKHSDLGVQATTVQTMRIANAEEFIYNDQRVTAAKQARKDSLVQMQNSSDMRAKVGAAACYFQGFEYQAWKGVESDDAAKRDLLYLRAMQEFTRFLGEYLPGDITKTEVTLDDAKMENLYALSAAVQEVYENAVPNTPTMLDLIRQALRLNDVVNKGNFAESDLKEWQKEALDNYPELVYFLQIRTSFLAAMTLGKMTNFSELSKTDDGKAIILKEVVLGWNMDLSKTNLERIVMSTKWLNAADDTAAYLISINEPVNVDNKLRRIFGKMSILDKSEHASEKIRVDDVTSFKSAFQAFQAIKP